MPAMNYFLNVTCSHDFVLDTNECDSNPCVNGNCTDELNAYSCQCYYGFYGDDCEHNIDDCGDNACDNNGTCIDGTASYECDCPSHFTGNLCEVQIGKSVI
jgi:Notch-like protein